MSKDKSIYKERDSILLDLIYAIQNGHDEELEKVILMSEPIINGVFKKVNKTSRFYLRNNYDDMMQEGRMAVMNAVKTYDAKRGTSPSTHIYNKCYAEMVNYVRSIYKGNAADIRLDDEKIESLEAGEVDILKRMVTEEDVLTMLNSVSKKEREVLIYKYWWDFKNFEIASIMDVSIHTTKKRFRTSKKKLNSNFPEYKIRGDNKR